MNTKTVLIIIAALVAYNAYKKMQEAGGLLPEPSYSVQLDNLFANYVDNNLQAWQNAYSNKNFESEAEVKQFIKKEFNTVQKLNGLRISIENLGLLQ